VYVVTRDIALDSIVVMALAGCGSSATQASDKFAVQFVTIVKSLVAGSMSAKVKFSCVDVFRFTACMPFARFHLYMECLR